MSKNDGPSAVAEVFGKLGLTVAILFAMFTPLWIFLGVNAYLEPTTFAEKALMIGLGYIFLGAAQIWALFLGVVGIIGTWSD